MGARAVPGAGAKALPARVAPGAASTGSTAASKISGRLLDGHGLR
jgi:hypothetical protein